MIISQELYERKVKCLLCTNEYMTKKVLRKAIKIERVDGDFCTFYKGVNPNHYLVNVCPECGFAFMDNTTLKISKHQRSQYIEQVAAKWKKRDYGNGRSVQEAVVCFKLAVFCVQYLEQPARTVGGLCLQLAWLYREIGDEMLEARFLRDALDFYVHAFQTDIQIESDGKLSYLIGELYRRLGDDHGAVKYFNQVIHDKQAVPKYARLARKQWELLREGRRLGEEQDRITGAS